MRALGKRTLWYGLIILLGLLSALANILPSNIQQSLPDWYASNQFNLGLDLRGGSHLLLQVDMDELLTSENQQVADALVDNLRWRSGSLRSAPVTPHLEIEKSLRDTR